jgi:hypothetical protein
LLIGFIEERQLLGGLIKVFLPNRSLHFDFLVFNYSIGFSLLGTDELHIILAAKEVVINIF